MKAKRIFLKNTSAGQEFYYIYKEVDIRNTAKETSNETSDANPNSIDSTGRPENTNIAIATDDLQEKQPKRESISIENNFVRIFNNLGKS